MNQELINRVESRLRQIEGIVEKDIQLQNSSHHLNHAFVDLAKLVLNIKDEVNRKKDDDYKEPGR